jgi:hypothetical protein
LRREWAQGVIPCADSNKTEVRHSVFNESRQLFASKYRLDLPAEEELRTERQRRHVLMADGETEARNGE